MPRDPAGTYTYPPGIEGVPDQTIESADYNSFLHDVQADLNLPRPIVAGGSGASSADAALDNLSAEKFKQVVTNWDTTTWRAGSFYAATTATGTAPVASHAFAGIVYYANATDFIIEATDITDPVNPLKYIRVMAAGVWGNWMLGAGGTASTSDYTFSTTTTFPPGSGEIRLNNATQNSATEIFISHTTASGADNTGPILASVKADSEIYIQDKDEPAKYKIFTATGALVLSGADFRILAQLKTSGVDIVNAQRVLISASNIAVTKKNYVINGAMMVSQENGSTIGTVTAGGSYYAVDMFVLLSAGTAGTVTAQQIASTTPATPGGSPNRLQVVVTVTDGAVAAGDIVYIEHRIEGLRCVDLMFGTATVKTVTVRFGVKAPAGTYCVTMLNSAANRSLVREYTISAGEANTDVIRQLTFIGDTSGIWSKDNTAGMFLRWGLMVGSTFQQAAGSWGTKDAVGSPNQFNFMAAGNTFNLFDVSLTEGSVPPPFQVPDYASELAACMRYFWQAPTGTSFPGYAATAGAAVGSLKFPVTMRANPTIAFPSANAAYAVSFGTTGITSNNPPSLPSFITGGVAVSNSTPIQFNTPSSLTAGQGVVLYNSGAVINANARL